MEKSLVFSATHLPAGQARARQSLNAHLLFVIRRVGYVDRRGTFLALRSGRDALDPSSRGAVPQSKLSLYYQAWRTLYFARSAALGIVRLLDYAALPGKKYRRFAWGESNEKCGAWEGVAGQSRADSPDFYHSRPISLGTFELESADPQFNRAIKSQLNPF